MPEFRQHEAEIRSSIFSEYTEKYQLSAFKIEMGGPLTLHSPSSEQNCKNTSCIVPSFIFLSLFFLSTFLQSFYLWYFETTSSSTFTHSLDFGCSLSLWNIHNTQKVITNDVRNIVLSLLTINIISYDFYKLVQI